jgi:hypothetical protein
MDRSFIVEAQINQGESSKPAVAVLFMNSEPSKGLLADLGLCAIERVSEAKPSSSQPTEPTMYVFDRCQGAREITIKRFDWHGKVTGTEKVSGEPSVLIPPVSGSAADSLIYPPSAFVIAGAVRTGSRLDPVIAVLFLKPLAGCEAPKPDMRTIKRMGLEKITSVDSVAASDDVPCTSMYIFEKSPSASAVRVRRAPDWGKPKNDSEEILQGEPQAVIPKISGAAAERFVYPRNALGKSDFPRAPSVPPSGPSSVRPSGFPESRRNRG